MFVFILLFLIRLFVVLTSIPYWLLSLLLMFIFWIIIEALFIILIEPFTM